MAMSINMEESSFALSNMTFVRPAHFYINGFYDFPHGTYFYIFLCFVYIMTVFGNVVLLLIILLVRSLHTPKYMIVFNLALTDLCGSTALIPKLLDTFLFENRYISYEACLSYMFFVLFFGSVQSWTLVAMSFDRFVAICFPLHYHSVVSKPVIAALLTFVWLLALGVIAPLAGLIDRLSFCKTVVIQSFYCDNAPVYRISCNTYFINNQVGIFSAVIMLLVPLALVGCSYACITYALKRIVSGGERLKALKTCTSHLILVAIFFIPVISTNIAVHFPNFHPNTRMINSALTHTVPALLNPFIYSLKTEEMLTAIKKICRRRGAQHNETLM
ncbi:olfactory receptor 1-like [Periophthalmus magnuspinnatus]|uniref:olfactory receptor 1-like n=1 Tax=Periophthalmus magnuspinnatus TaxID=409849 RepID=UPI0024370935|nr:olfactory receptor 1-like [Periophthalmus magnuspinnatus]